MAQNRRGSQARLREVLRSLEPFDHEITKNRLEIEELEANIARQDDSPLARALLIEWRVQIEEAKQRIIGLEHRRSEIWESDRPDREDDPEPL